VFPNADSRAEIFSRIFWDIENNIFLNN